MPTTVQSTVHAPEGDRSRPHPIRAHRGALADRRASASVHLGGGEALDHLEKDNAFLLKGDVFTSDFLEMWISQKRKEHDALRLRPHPYEFFLYYDV